MVSGGGGCVVGGAGNWEAAGSDRRWWQRGKGGRGTWRGIGNNGIGSGYDAETDCFGSSRSFSPQAFLVRRGNGSRF